VPLLLDSHIVLGVIGGRDPAWSYIEDEQLFVSVASLWEIAIKSRQGKLELTIPLSDFEKRLDEVGCGLVSIRPSHAIAEVDPWPDTNDPFDRLLLGVCQVEGLRLVTRERKLVDHPLTWRAASA
jgi:PIN domain nuclease of toxin-antitoxin system